MGSVNTPQTIDEYILNYPPDIQKKIRDIRSVIKKAAPDAMEKISYRMPAYTFRGIILLYFAAHSGHLGFYPFTSAIEAFKEELSSYKTAKGSIRFPYNKPLPLKLISEIVKFRVQENILKEVLKTQKKKSKKIKNRN